MIKEITPLSMAEADKYIQKRKDVEFDAKTFIKKFSKIKPEKAKELREKLESLNIVKINEKHISKMIDFLPRDKSELNRVVSDAGLDEDEINKILETIKSYQ